MLLPEFSAVIKKRIGERPEANRFVGGIYAETCCRLCHVRLLIMNVVNRVWQCCNLPPRSEMSSELVDTISLDERKAVAAVAHLCSQPASPSRFPKKQPNEAKSRCAFHVHPAFAVASAPDA